VCAYRSWIDGELLGLTNAAGVGIGTVNADSTIHQGVEFGVSVTILQNVFVAKDDRFVLRTMYTWNDFFFDNDNVFGDNRLAGIPEHIFRAEIMYMHPSGFYMGPNVEWVPSEYPMDHRNSFFVDPYAIMGVKVGYRTGSGFSAFIEGRNLLDERHTATSGVIANANGADTRNFLPGDGISVYVGGEYRR
jgi:iron complex outermembrane receptor protein